MMKKWVYELYETGRCGSGCGEISWWSWIRDGPAAPEDGGGTREAIVSVKEGVNFYFFINYYFFHDWCYDII